MHYWLVFLVISVCSCQTYPNLPNNAEYFWCSQLYNPYYPLNPYNFSLPLLNDTDHFNYPQPEIQVSPEYSLYPNQANTANVLVKANATACGGCLNVYGEISYNNATISKSSISVNNNELFEFPLSSIPKNATSQILVSIYKDSNYNTLLFSQEIDINIFSSKNDQVYIDYLSKGLIVYEKPWFPMGFYFAWDTPDKFVLLAVDETRNAMQTPLPYRPPTPPNSEFIDYMTLASDMRTKVHFDMYELSEEANSETKW